MPPRDHSGAVLAWQKRLMASEVPGTELLRYALMAAMVRKLSRRRARSLRLRLDGSEITQFLWISPKGRLHDPGNP